MKNYKEMKANKGESGKENIKPVNWEELFVLVRYWISDLEFYLEDMRFLHKLINKYSIWLKRQENSEAVSKVAAELQNLTEQGKILQVKIKEHLNKIGELIKHKSDKEAEFSLKQHGVLEDEIAEFVKDFRTNRREVFKVSEKVIDSENLTDLMKE